MPIICSAGEEAEKPLQEAGGTQGSAAAGNGGLRDGERGEGAWRPGPWAPAQCWNPGGLKGDPGDGGWGWGVQS